jgi:hypothetical protein
MPSPDVPLSAVTTKSVITPIWENDAPRVRRCSDLWHQSVDCALDARSRSDDAPSLSASRHGCGSAANVASIAHRRRLRPGSSAGALTPQATSSSADPPDAATAVVTARQFRFPGRVDCRRQCGGGRPGISLAGTPGCPTPGWQALENVHILHDARAMAWRKLPR